METHRSDHLVRPVVKRTGDTAQDDPFLVFIDQAARLEDPLVSHQPQPAEDGFAAEIGALHTETFKIGYRKSGPLLRYNQRPDEAAKRPDEAAKRRRTFQLFLVIAGHGFVKAQGKALELKPGGIYLTSSDMDFSLEYSTPHSVLGVDFPARILSFPERFLFPLFFANSICDPALSSMFSNAIEWLFTLDELDKQGVESYMTGVVNFVLRAGIGIGHDKLGFERTETRVSRRRQVEQFVRDNINNPGLSAHMIASALHISPRLVYQLFENHTETLNEFIRRERVEHAEQLISASGRKRILLDQLARQTGFGSKRTLVRAFERIHGTSPIHYARIHGHWV